MDPSELVGQTLGEVYRVEEQLGAGGMGAVYGVHHLRTGRPYAVKVLKLEVAVRKDAMQRFAREAEAMGALHHANVVAIHDFHVDGTLAYLVMDRLEGEDLAGRMERLGPMGLEEVLAIAEGIGSGLDAAHARGMIHRDLKPANVFLARQPGAPERAVLLDFGLAKSLGGDEELALTASGVVMGTPQYMSPEQASGRPLDARADLYSLATIVYEMLAGRPPFEAPTIPALFAQLAMSPAPPLSGFRPDLPEGVSSVLDRALAKKPDDRYPDAASLLEALRVAARGGAVAPAPSATPVGNAAGSWPRPSVDAFAPTTATPASTRVASTRVVAPAPTGAARTGSSRGALVIALLVFALVAIAGTAAGVGAFLLAEQDAGAELASAPPSPADPDPTEGDPAPSPELDPPIVDDVPDPVEPEPVERVEPVEADPPPPRVRRRRPPPDRPAPTVEPDREDPDDQEADDEAPAGGPPPGATPPPGGPPAGVRETVAFMGRRDFRGCIRESRRHPRSEALLAARMNCAIQLQDHDAIRSACADIRRHYPRSAYNQTCSSIMTAYGISP